MDAVEMMCGMMENELAIIDPMSLPGTPGVRIVKLTTLQLHLFLSEAFFPCSHRRLLAVNLLLEGEPQCRIHALWRIFGNTTQDHLSYLHLGTEGRLVSLAGRK